MKLNTRMTDKIKPKTEIIMVRVSPQTKERLEKLAESWETSASGAVRRLILEAAQEKAR